MRFIRDLSPETQRLLRRCYKESQHHRVRQRAHCILLSFDGKTTKELMHIFDVERLTIYHWFDAWERRHFAGLYDHAKCGRPPKLTEAEQENSKRVSTKTLKRLLKKTAMSGNALNAHQRRPRTLRSMSGLKR